MFFFDDDDAGDYELEPVDEHVVRQAENRAREELAQAERAIDVDRVYRELEGRSEEGESSWEPGAWEPGSWKPSSFSFGIKHLLLATGAFALLLGLWQMGLFSVHGFSVLVALSLVVLGAAHAFFDWRDRRRQEATFARQRYDHGRAMGEIGINIPPPETPSTSLATAWEGVKRDLRGFLRFGIRELLIITAVVAVLTVIARTITLGFTAVLVGMIALGGLGLQAFDFELSRSMKIVWWASIFAYCILTVISAIATAIGFQ